MTFSRLTLLGVLALTCGCTASPEPSLETADAQRARWDALVETFTEDYFAVLPAAGVGVGRHEFDGQIPDLSAAGIATRARVLASYRDQAQAFPESGLDRDRRFERELMIWYMGRRLFWIEGANWPRTNPMYYRGAINPSVYLNREYAPLGQRMVALTQLLEAMPRALQQMADQLQPRIANSLLKRSIGYYSGLASHLRKTVPVLFAKAGTAEQRAALLASNDAATVALDALVTDLRARQAQADDNFALGAALYAQMLRETELVETPLEQLKARGEADLARNLRALTRVCTDQLQRPNLKECMALADTQKSLDPVARGQQQLGMLKQFVVDRDLVTIPSDEAALVRQSPPYNRANLAYITIPGAFEPQPLPSIYYISPPDPSWTEQEQRDFVPNEGRLLYVSVHEVWPGHFLWGLHRNRAERPLVPMFSATTFSEGWAHYVEEMMHEQGLGAGEPMLHVGQLANALKRNVRYLSAIGLHTEGMTLAQSQQMFLEQGLLDVGNARQQAARGAYDPGYLSYTLGKLQIMDLRERWLAEQSGRTLKQFHDALLSYGGAPLALVEKYMLAQDQSPTG